MSAIFGRAMIDKKRVEEVAKLACLKITKDQCAVLEDQFHLILEDFEKLNQVDTKGVAPMITPHEEKIDLRRDEVQNELSVDDVLKNAPDVQGHLFRVPPVV
ncbi:MAG: Asp-tRNA(Asn)/Glu-tRNA(Gln) amidotransferase subunit GatC [Bdellovibrionales bacterium]|nr:Asp-tRNA(Asn)/Glu-tRNA(Gln) amidotransferase subunit GatC [Bdellovibrionales bacterium]